MSEYPREYGATEDLSDLNTYQPYPAAAITMNSPVDSLGERYRLVVEFDLSSEEAYDAMVTEYPDAWDAYYDEAVAPAYSPENAVKLQEAIKFWLYMDDGETVNVDPSFDSVFSQGEEIRVDAPRVSPYMRESGGTYENPDAAYNQDVYDRVTNGETEPIPLLETDSSRDVADRAIDKPQLLDMYSSYQLARSEYELHRSSPVSQYDQFGPYATGKNTY